MLRSIYRRISLGDGSLRGDQVTDTFGVGGIGSITSVIGDSDLSAGIGEQGEVEIELLRERRVIGDGIEADPQDLNSSGIELGLAIAEPATFGRSTRGIRLGIEPKEDFPAPIIGEPNRLSVMIE